MEEEKNEETRQYRATYNPDRECYISEDGKYICYDTWDSEQNKPTTIRVEVGKSYKDPDGTERVITEDITFLIDDLNYSMDLGDRYYNESKDPLFEKKRQKYEADPEGDEAVDPWDTISRPQDSPEYEQTEENENPDLARIRKSVDEDLTKEQQDLYFQHFGMGKQLEEIRQEEIAVTGRDKSLQSVGNRKNKIIKKVAKRVFGVEPIKRKKTNRTE